MSRPGARTRFTYDASSERQAIWSLDGSRIVFTGGQGRTLYESPAGGTGSGTPLIEDGEFSKYADSWSSDGRYFLFASGPDTPTQTGNDVWVLPCALLACRSQVGRFSVERVRPL